MSFWQWAKDWNVKSWAFHAAVGCLLPLSVWLLPHAAVPVVAALLLGIWAEQSQGHIQGDRMFIDWGPKRWIDVATYVAGGAVGSLVVWLRG